jgi:hypothetical protein
VCPAAALAAATDFRGEEIPDATKRVLNDVVINKVSCVLRAEMRRVFTMRNMYGPDRYSE